MMKSRVRKFNKTSGFSLVELIVVIAILGMLMLLMVSNYGKFFSGSKKKVAEMLVTKTMEAPLMMYMSDMGRYPTTQEGLQALVRAPSGKRGRWNGPYIKDAESLMDPWKNPLQYRCPGQHNPDGYDLWSMGPGASSMTSRPLLFLGKAMQSRMLSRPAKIDTKRSRPKASPACGGAPYLKALMRKPN